MDAIFNERGEQMPDNTPVELPLGYQHPEDLQSMIRRMVVDAAIVQAQNEQGIDTEEEANDFDVMDEDHAPPSGYEYTEMHEEMVTKARMKEKEEKPYDEGKGELSEDGTTHVKGGAFEKPKPKQKKSKTKVEEPVETVDKEAGA